MELGGTYVPDKEPQRARRRRMFWGGGVSGGIVLLAVILVWVFVLSPLFAVKSIAVEGASGSSGDIVAAVQAGIGGGSWWKRVLGSGNILAWPASLGQTELRFLPGVKSAVVERDLRARSVRVLVMEREPLAVWCLAKQDPPQCFWFDADGVLMKRGFATQGNLIRVVNDYAHDSLGLGDAVLPAMFMSNFFEDLRVLDASGISVKETALTDLAREELAVTTYGPKIYFSLRFPPEGALDVLASLQKQGKFRALEYVDFRVEHRAYYK